jgi:hypothetical protein
MLQARRGWLGFAVCVWTGLLLGLAVFGYCYPWSHTVYNIYAKAGRNWWAGQDLYADEETAYFRYSPLFAVGMTPFAVLSDNWGNAVWRVFNGLVYVAGLWVWARRVLSPTPPTPFARVQGRAETGLGRSLPRVQGRRELPAIWTRAKLGAFLLLALPVSLSSLYNGQANLLMLGAILLALAAAAGQRWNRAAGWLAAATLIKGYPIALAMLVIALFPRRLGLRYALALIIGLALPFAFQRPAIVASQYASWWAHLQDSTVIMRERLRTVEHLFALYGHALAPRTVLAFQVLGGGLVLALCLFHAWQVPNLRSCLNVTFLLFCLWTALLGPATESCTYAVMGPAVAWALVDVWSRPTRVTTRMLVAGCLLLMGPATTDMVGLTLRNFANTHGSQPIGALLFLAFLLPQVGKLGRTLPEEEALRTRLQRELAA